jgi:hypothetical protein
LGKQIPFGNDKKERQEQKQKAGANANAVVLRPLRMTSHNDDGNRDTLSLLLRMTAVALTLRT